MSPFPITRRIFTSRIQPERWYRESARLTALVVVLGLSVLSGWSIVQRMHTPRCERYDARHDIGLTEEGKLCRKR
jgi:hypothetical protein